MALIIKIFLFWLVIDIMLYAATKASYKLSRSSLNWEYYKKDTWIGASYLLWFTFGLVGQSIYIIAKLGEWWFSN